MRFYLKALKAYFNQMFRPDPEERELDEWQFKSNIFKRYMYYCIEELMIVNPKTGHYEPYEMPKPFNIPGKIAWGLEEIWQTKFSCLAERAYRRKRS